MPGPTQTPPQQRRVTVAQLAEGISKGTGLTLAATLAWIRAENGPTDNLLGLKDTSGNFRSFTNGADQAAAVVANLHTPLYKPVIDAAQNAPTNTKAQLEAIAQSPWDAGHYTGSQTGTPTPGVPWGTTLIGALKSIGGPNLNNGDVVTSTFEGAGTTQTPFDPLSSLTGWTKQLAGWVNAEAATGLAYVVLTTLGITLVLIGVLEIFGHTPSEGAALALSGGRTTRRPRAGEPGSSQLARGDSLPF
jgi:hypothetical protein